MSDAAAVTDFVQDADIALGAMPSALGFQTLRRVIEAGRDYCDISFMTAPVVGSGRWPTWLTSEGSFMLAPCCESCDMAGMMAIDSIGA